MKKILFCLSCFFTLFLSVAFASEEIIGKKVFNDYQSHYGDIDIKSSTKSIDKDRSMTSFIVVAPCSGEYDAYFWALGSLDSKKASTSYYVYINNLLIGEICPQIADWQIAKLKDEHPVFLNSGENVITIEGTVPDIPDIEFVNMTKVGRKSTISADAYNSYKRSINECQHIQPKGDLQYGNRVIAATSPLPYLADTISSAFPPATTENPLYDYDFELDVKVSYTFYKYVHFSSGSQIHISTNADSNFRHVLEFFNMKTPALCSLSALSNSNNSASINITIPNDGVYCVRVRSYWNQTHGTCDVNINNQYYYEDVPVFSYGLRGVQPSATTYNSFTCYSNQDPMIWMETGTSIPGIIIDSNDNYRGSGTFDWGANARIKKNYRMDIKTVQVTSAYSYLPTDTLDVYARCKNSNAYLYFENLHEDDAIASSPASYQYNCISWSGGITSYWEWPLSPFSDYSIGATALDCFDLFYNAIRYPGCSRFTRIGATEQNSVIDLWGHVYDGYISYTHASVRKDANGHAHGYDWESKPGALTRTFHPRYAVDGVEGYGQVVAYYRKLSPQMGISLEEAIARGDAILEYNEFTDDEIDFINEEIESIPATTINSFSQLWNTWKDSVMDSPASNLDILADCPEYRSLLQFCRNNTMTKYLVYREMVEDDLLITKLLSDLTIASNQNIINNIFINNASNIYNDQGQVIVRSPFTNAMAYVKCLLDADPSNSHARSLSGTSGVSYSNDVRFNLYARDKTLGVMCDMAKDSNIEIAITTLDGRLLASGTYDCHEDEFCHEFKIKYSGTILVCLRINGRTNVKKIEM